MDGLPHSGGISLEFSPRRNTGGEVFVHLFLGVLHASLWVRTPYGPLNSMHFTRMLAVLGPSFPVVSVTEAMLLSFLSCA
jgi:hypothetical protein